jgi:hypothetical protein
MQKSVSLRALQQEIRRHNFCCFVDQPLLRIPLFSSSPFAAPNSHSTPKFDHSLTFTLLLKNIHATLPHGRPYPGANREARSWSTRRTPSAPDVQTSPPSFVAPLFSYSYKPIFPQLLYFHIHTNPPGSFRFRPMFHALKRANSFVCIGLEPLCRLFLRVSALVSFVFNRLQPLFQEQPGWGYLVRPSALPLRPQRLCVIISPRLPYPERSCWSATLFFGFPPSAALPIPLRGGA